MKYYHYQFLHNKKQEGENEENTKKKGKIKKQMRSYRMARKSRLKH